MIFFFVTYDISLFSFIVSCCLIYRYVTKSTKKGNDNIKEPIIIVVC